MYPWLSGSIFLALGIWFIQWFFYFFCWSRIFHILLKPCLFQFFFLNLRTNKFYTYSLCFQKKAIPYLISHLKLEKSRGRSFFCMNNTLLLYCIFTDGQFNFIRCILDWHWVMRDERCHLARINTCIILLISDVCYGRSLYYWLVKLNRR